MKGYQFSLRTLLAAVAAVGIGAALWVAEPSWQVGAVEFLLLALLPATTAMLCVSSTGKARAFWVGVTVESLLPTIGWAVYGIEISLNPYLANGSNPQLDLLHNWLLLLSGNFRPVLLVWAFAPIVGLLCVLTHWLFIRSADPAEPRD